MIAFILHMSVRLWSGQMKASFICGSLSTSRRLLGRNLLIIDTRHILCPAQGFTGSLHRATVRSQMLGAGDSSACLAARTCLPLGGHSVWAAMPPPG